MKYLAIFALASTLIAGPAFSGGPVLDLSGSATDCNEDPGATETSLDDLKTAESDCGAVVVGQSKGSIVDEGTTGLLLMLLLGISNSSGSTSTTTTE